MAEWRDRAAARWSSKGDRSRGAAKAIEVVKQDVIPRHNVFVGALALRCKRSGALRSVTPSASCSPPLCLTRFRTHHHHDCHHRSKSRVSNVPRSQLHQTAGPASAKGAAAPAPPSAPKFTLVTFDLASMVSIFHSLSMKRELCFPPNCYCDFFSQRTRALLDGGGGATSSRPMSGRATRGSTSRTTGRPADSLSFPSIRHILIIEAEKQTILRRIIVTAFPHQPFKLFTAVRPPHLQWLASSAARVGLQR